MSTTDATGTTDVKQLTLQEIFTKVVLHARKQRAKAMNSAYDMCMYRAGDGRKCFAGCLIKDDYYSPELEGQIPTIDIVAESLARSGVSAGLATAGRCCFRLICDLQGIHDSNDVDQWERRFRETATGYDLVVPEPTDELPMLPE